MVAGRPHEHSVCVRRPREAKHALITHAQTANAHRRQGGRHSRAKFKVYLQCVKPANAKHALAVSSGHEEHGHGWREGVGFPLGPR